MGEDEGCAEPCWQTSRRRRAAVLLAEELGSHEDWLGACSRIWLRRLVPREPRDTGHRARRPPSDPTPTLGRG